MILFLRNKNFKLFIVQVLCLFYFITTTSYSAVITDVPLKFVIPDFPPYTYIKNQQASGVGVEKTKKVMRLANINHTINLVKDYGIAMLLMKKNKADGMFLASENEQRNNIATFTKPLLMNRWCWYFKAESGLTPLKRRFKRNAKVGTILNTNTHQWLTNNDYRITGKPDNAAALNKMLLADRVNAVFVSESVFEAVIEKDKYYLYHKIIEVEKPFGIYISNKYIAEHPTIIKQLNDAITQLTQQNKL